ncbi:MAG: LuxR C-terminal-related transcriptional regulator [Paracoccaceae bacterium]
MNTGRFLIDLADGLAANDPRERLWARGLSFMDYFGADWISVLRATTEAPTRVTVDTSVDRAMMDQYVGDGIYKFDPWQTLCSTSPDPVRLTTDTARGADVERDTSAVDARFVAFMEGFGVRHAVLVPYAAGAQLGSVVLIARSRESMLQLGSPQLALEAHVAAHLLAAHLDVDLAASAGLARYETEGGLSSRERETLQWLGSGLRTDRIAEKMGIAPVTVNAHLASARAKLGARTREQALALALARRLISL